jgi:NitT/TauT family transport system ATP-binding protein
MGILGMIHEGGGGPNQGRSALRQTSAREPVLNVHGVTLQYKTPRHLVTATYRVDFSVYPADRFVVLGPSGCGKSTLLKAIGGFLRPAEGEISVQGRTIDRPGPDRMMVFQEFDQLLPWKTVRENVAFPMVASRKFSRKTALERADHYLRLVNLIGFARSHPHQLSGGMKQRVAIARAMAMEPAILLMDEPFAALDALTRRKMQDELLALWTDVKCTIVFVTHSIEEAILIGNRILILSPHPGRVQALLEPCRGPDDRVPPDEYRTIHQQIQDMLFGDDVMQQGAGI